MKKISIILTLPFIFLTYFSFGIEENKDEILRKGLIVYKKANCMGVILGTVKVAVGMVQAYLCENLLTKLMN